MCGTWYEVRCSGRYGDELLTLRTLNPRILKPNFDIHAWKLHGSLKNGPASSAACIADRLRGSFCGLQLQEDASRAWVLRALRRHGFGAMATNKS